MNKAKGEENVNKKELAKLESFRKRRDKLLLKLHRDGMITQKQYEECLKIGHENSE